MADPPQPDPPDAAADTIWTRPARGSRGPEPEHTRDEIASAAMALADSGGLPAVTMRAVAAGMGTAAGSLYRYVASRRDLVDLMVDAAVAEISLDPPPTGDPIGDLLALAGRQLAVYRRHPWLVDALSAAPAPGPRTVDYFEYCLRLMAPLRCGTATKLEAVAMMVGVTSLFARAATATAAHPFAISAQAHPHLTAAFARPGAPPRPDLFERTVRSVLRGLLRDEDPR